MAHPHRVLFAALAGASVSILTTTGAFAAPYVQTDLVSDIPGLATITEPTLVNPWGISHSATSPFWISDQGTSLTNLWAVTGQTNIMKVTAVNPPTGNIMIPMTASGPQGPTGQVNNSNTSSFPVGNGGDGGSAHFIFANLNGTISAWDTGPTAFIQVTPAVGAPTVYSGLAINQAQTLLYAANDAGSGSINAFNKKINPCELGARKPYGARLFGVFALVQIGLKFPFVGCESITSARGERASGSLSTPRHRLLSFSRARETKSV